jgi:hypothetical protein
MIVPSLGAIGRSISFVHCSPLDAIVHDHANSFDYVSKAEIDVRMLRNIKYNGRKMNTDDTLRTSTG